MILKIFVDVHFVVIIEIDMDKNLVVQRIDDNNIVERDEFVANMLLYRQQIKKTAKMKIKFIIFLVVVESMYYIIQTNTRHLDCWNKTYSSK